MQFVAIGDYANQYAWRDSNDSSELPIASIGCVKPNTVSGAKSGATKPNPEIDPTLATVISAWPTLPEAIRAGIVAMVKASAPTASNHLKSDSTNEAM
jgi:hypothetical protein